MSDKTNPLRCPECDHEHHVSWKAVIPERQTLTWEITMEESSPVAARTIWESAQGSGANHGALTHPAHTIHDSLS